MASTVLLSQSLALVCSWRSKRYTRWYNTLPDKWTVACHEGASVRQSLQRVSVGNAGLSPDCTFHPSPPNDLFSRVI